jgi:hypothetical protein
MPPSTQQPEIEIILPSERGRQQLPPELEFLAQLMDGIFHIPGLGIRFGLDAIIGLFPGLGDTITSVVSLYILRVASQYGIPRVTLVRMAANIVIDTLLGSVPVVGDLFDVYWKANLKNVALLQNHLDASPRQQRQATRGDTWFLVALAAIVLLFVVGTTYGAYLIVSGLLSLLFGR